jgi:hypothetical protein
MTGPLLLLLLLFLLLLLLLLLLALDGLCHQHWQQRRPAGQLRWGRGGHCQHEGSSS